MPSRELRIRDHFLAPQHAGRIDSPTASGRAENRVCGDVLEVFVRVEEGRIVAAGYVAEGCAALRATASLVCSVVAPGAAEEALQLDVAGLVQTAGGLPPSKAHAPRVVQRALREALA